MKKRIAVYTSIYGQYDRIKEPVFLPDLCDFFIFTDQDLVDDSIWIKLINPFENELASNNLKNRFIKMHPHMLFQEYEFSIYIDGTVQILDEVKDILFHLERFPILMLEHPDRTCAYEEIKKCLKLNKSNKNDLKQHRKYLHEQGFPHNFGMLVANVIIRKHNDPLCIELMEQWWQEFCIRSKRDQISLPYILWKNNVEIESVALPRSEYADSVFFVHPHRVQSINLINQYIPPNTHNLFEINCNAATLKFYLPTNIFYWGSESEKQFKRAAQANVDYFIDTFNINNAELFPNHLFDVILLRNKCSIDIEKLVDATYPKLSYQGFFIFILPNTNYLPNYLINVYSSLINLSKAKTKKRSCETSINKLVLKKIVTDKNLKQIEMQSIHNSILKKSLLLSLISKSIELIIHRDIFSSKFFIVLKKSEVYKLDG